MLEELMKKERLCKKYYDIPSVESISGGVGMKCDDYDHDHDNDLGGSGSGRNQEQYQYQDEENQGIGSGSDTCFHPNHIIYPETARWALCGMKNLSRPPCKDSFASHRLIQCGILPILLQTLNVKKKKKRQDIENRDPDGLNIETE